MAYRGEGLERWKDVTPAWALITLDRLILTLSHHPCLPYSICVWPCWPTLLKIQLWSCHHPLLNFYSVSRTCRIKFKPLSCDVWGPWPLSSACLSKNLCGHSLELSAPVIRLISSLSPYRPLASALSHTFPFSGLPPASPLLSVVAQVKALSSTYPWIQGRSIILSHIIVMYISYNCAVLQSITWQ